MLEHLSFGPGSPSGGRVPRGSGGTMTDETEIELTLDLAPCGRNGTATVTARLGPEVLLVDKLDLARSKAREAFAAKLCEGRPGLDQAAVLELLLREAARFAERPEPEPTGPAAEVDASRIIRPERIITPEVSGFSIPTMTAAGDKVLGRWEAYLRWADGRREKRPLGTALEMPDGGRLFVHPQPGEPTPSTKLGWTAAGRKKWLDGEPAPDAGDVFQRLCRAIDYYLDLPGKSAAGTAPTLALWTILSYGYHAWPAVPYLYLGGPLGSGKSRVFEILSRLCFRPLATSNLTAASLFRSLHAFGGTLLLDEAERLKKGQDPDVGEILSMLLAGYKRGGSALRLEPIGDSGFKTVSFDVFSPKALACIAGLPPALQTDLDEIHNAARRSRDITRQLLALGRRQTGRPRVVVGFAAETQDLLANAAAKLTAKKLDLIVANDVTEPGSGFGADDNRVTLLFADGRQEPLPIMSKAEVADRVLAAVLPMLQRD